MILVSKTVTYVTLFNLCDFSLVEGLYLHTKVSILLYFETILLFTSLHKLFNLQCPF